MAAPIYTRSPWNVVIPVGSEVSSPSPSTGFVWIVRWIGLVQSPGTGNTTFIKSQYGRFIFKWTPTTGNEGYGLELRWRLEAGQVLKVTAQGAATDVGMTVYEFTL